jgi:hypothetical protein
MQHVSRSREEKLQYAKDHNVSPALVGFELHFHTLAKATLVGKYGRPAEKSSGVPDVARFLPRCGRHRLAALATDAWTRHGGILANRASIWLATTSDATQSHRGYLAR